MERAGPRRVIFFAALAVTAFLLNYCWESLHGLLYNAHPEMAAMDYVPMMLFMASMDTLGIIALYALTAIAGRTWFWNSGLRNNTIFFLFGIVAAYVVEYITLYKLHLWQYGPSMPILFGVGLSPLFQLSLSGLFSIYVARLVAGSRHYITGSN